LREVEGRLTKSLDDCDEFRSRVQNLSKDNTEMKLKIDVDKSTIDGLNSEMKHSVLELKEAKDLCHVFETKCENLIKEVSVLSHELSSNKRDMIFFT
jgi:uncharacterized coiled-coil DUF342 family protein